MKFMKLNKVLKLLTSSKEKSLRLAALRALSTLIVSFCERFADKQAIGVFEYLLHLTDDRSAKVRRLADWCVIALVECVPAELCLNYLALLTTFAGHRVHAAAICLIMQIIRGASKEMMNNKVVGSIIDCLFEGYCSEDDEVQRASLRCLSIIYNVVGRDCMEPHMAHLTSSQLKLLDSSVRRAKREEILVRHSLSKRR
ncbi:hypothetical protein LSAT2_002292 [Lamellibrachia satsuma]|nr:hypothetical protein LSAT2_002292 [Lamellibrachia satsuma]